LRPPAKRYCRHASFDEGGLVEQLNDRPEWCLQEAFRALMNAQNQLSLQITPVITVAREFAQT
jgi:hypothetical protein